MFRPMDVILALRSSVLSNAWVRDIEVMVAVVLLIFVNPPEPNDCNLILSL